MKKADCKFFIKHPDGKGVSMYYRKNGNCFVANNNYNKKLDVLVWSPARRISNEVFETDMKRAEKVYY